MSSPSTSTSTSNAAADSTAAVTAGASVTSVIPKKPAHLKTAWLQFQADRRPAVTQFMQAKNDKIFAERVAENTKTGGTLMTEDEIKKGAPKPMVISAH
jgi:hypothetical protein